MPRAVLVTGVSRYLGGRFARRLAAVEGLEVIGVDVVPPRQDLGAARFVRADIRSATIAKVILGEQVDTVVHMNVIATPRGAGGRTIMKDVNVIGSMQLLAACQKAPGVERLVIKSSSTVYGASPRDPAMFTEDMEPRALPRSGFAKDSVEVEGYVRGFARRRPDVTVSILRFANCLGPVVDTPLSAYLSLPVIPRKAGFDPRLQFVHEDDLVAALELCTLADRPGTFNVAGDGVLLLSQAARRMGKPLVPVPGPLMGTVARLGRRSGLVDLSPEQGDYLTYGRGIDTSRMRTVLGVEPAYTTAETFADFVAGHGQHGMLTAPRLQAAEDMVRAGVTALTQAGAR